MNLSLKNKVALVTGAASGIGFATARAYAEAGAAVVLADINSELVNKAANDLISRGLKLNRLPVMRQTLMKSKRWFSSLFPLTAIWISLLIMPVYRINLLKSRTPPWRTLIALMP
jgi:hypothetical protein